jgi:hypothetical protein
MGSQNCINLCTINGTPLGIYDEGLWTPILNFGGATTGITYSVQGGMYTRVGNRIFLCCRILLTSKGTATGKATITGAPFIASCMGTVNIGRYAYINLKTAAYSSIATIQTATDTIELQETGDNVAILDLDDTDFSNNSEIMFTLIYTV